MKKLLALLGTIVLAIFLFSCDGNTDVALRIEGIRGHTDAVIDNENSIVSFSVDASTETFAISDIILPTDMELSVYGDSEHTTQLTDILTLEEGLNTFYLSVYIAGNDAFSSSWILQITRLELSLTAISVKTLKSAYTLNEEFSEGVLLLTYQGGSTKEITLVQTMVIGFDTTSVGQKTMTITYEGLKTNYDYEVVKTAKSLEVLELNQEYYLNDVFTPGQLIIQYDDDSNETIDLTLDMVSGFDTSTIGEKTLTISYAGLSISYTIMVREDYIQSIAVKELKATYYVGDDFTNGTLTLTYASGKTADVALTVDMVTGFDTKEAGSKTLTITYAGITQNYDIEIIVDEVTSLQEINFTRDYYLNANFVPAKLKVTYASGKTEEVDLTLDMVTGFSTAEVGSKELTITYAGFSIKVMINVVVAELTTITVKELKDTYYVGDEFVNGILTLTYADNSTLDTTLTIAMVEGFSTIEVGIKTLTITYEDITTTYTIEVIADTIASIAVKELKDTYYVGEELSSGTLILTYASGKTKEIALTKEMVTGFDSSEVGTQTLTISYLEFKITYDVNIITDEVKDITIVELQDSYIVNEKFSSGTLLVAYASGKSDEISLTIDMVTGFDTTTEGQKIMTISYGGISKEYSYNVINTIEKIEVAQLASTYFVGDTFKDGQLLVTYSDQSTTTIKLTSEMVIGFNTSRVGKVTLVISYADFTISYQINVIADEIIEIKVKEYKDTYYDTEDFGEGVLELIYTSGKTSEVTLTPSMIKVVEEIEGEPDKRNLVITYAGLEVDFLITYVADEAKDFTTNLKTDYYVGEAFPSDANIVVTYASGISKKMALTMDMVTNFSTETIGTVTLTISFDNLSKEFNITIKEDVISSIEVVDLQSVYYIGDEFLSGLLQINYASGNIELITLTKEMVSDFTTETAGEKTLTINYNDISTTYLITVKENQAIELVVKEFKSTYYVGEEFLPGLLTVIYENGKVAEVPLEASMVSGFTTETVGEKTLTINYLDLTINYPIIVKEDEIVSIVEQDFTYEYKINATYQPANLLVSYMSGKQETIPLTMDMISGFDTASSGTKTITINYASLTLNITINVVEAALININVFAYRDKYYQYEEFETCRLLLNYDDGSSLEVDLTKAMLQNFDTTTLGTKTIVVNYGGLTTEFNIEVVADTINNIELVDAKTTYYVGDELGDIIINVSYESGKEETIKATMDMVPDFSTAEANFYSNVAIYFGEAVTYFDYEVIEDTPQEIVAVNLAKTYLIGDTFLEGTITILGISGKEKEYQLTYDMVSGFNTSSIGAKILKISYYHLTTDYTIEVLEPDVKEIAVENLTSTYYLGQAFIDGTLSVLYVNDYQTSIPLTSDMVSGFATNELGTKTITITYKDLTIEYQITVVGDMVVAIGVAELANQYYLNDEFIAGSLSIIYASGLKEIVDLTLDMVIGFSTTEVGYHTMTIMYDNLTTTYNYLVLDPIMTGEFVLPEKSTLTYDTVLDLLLAIQAVQPYGQEYTTYEETFQALLDNDIIGGVEEAINYFEIAGITEDDVAQISSIFKNDIGQVLYDLIYDFTFNYHEFADVKAGLESFLTDENINLFKNSLADILGLVDKNQWTVIATYILSSATNTISTSGSSYSSYIGQIIGVSLGDYIDYLKGTDVNTSVLGLLEGIFNFNAEYEYQYADIYNLVDLAYDILLSITKVNNEDIRNIVINFFKVGFNEFSKEDMVVLINAVCNALEVINEGTNNFAALTRVLNTVSKFINKFTIQTYSIILQELELIKGIIKYLDVIIDVARAFDEEIVNIILNFSSSMQNGDGASLIKLAVVIRPLAEVCYTDNELNKCLTKLAYASMFNSTSVNKLLALILEASALDANNQEDADKVFNDFYSIMVDDIITGVYTSYIPVISNKASDEEIYSILSQYYNFRYLDKQTGLENPISINSTNVTLDTDKEIGLHTAILRQAGLEYEFYYYLYDETITFTIYSMNFETLTNNLFLIPLNGQEFDEQALSISDWHYDRPVYNSVDNIINNISILLYNVDVLNNLYLHGSDFTYEMVFDSSSVGLKRGYIEFTGITNFALPFEYYVYDEKNPTVTDFKDFIVRTDYNDIYYNNGETIKLQQGATINSIQLRDVLINFNNSTNNITFSEEELTKIDTSTLGSYAANLLIQTDDGLFGTFTFNYEVLSSEELYQIRNISLSDTIYLEDGNYKIPSYVSFHLNNYIDKVTNILSLDELKEYVTSHYAQNATINLNVTKKTLDYGYQYRTETYLEIVAGDNILFSQRVSNVYVIGDNHYNDYTHLFIAKENLDILVDNPNELTLEYLVSTIGQVTLEKEYAHESLKITTDVYNQLLAKGITMELKAEDMDYGKTYIIEFYYNDEQIDVINSNLYYGSSLEIRAYAKEYENTLIDIEFRINDMIPLIELSIEGVKKYISSYAQIVLKYPTKTEIIAREDVISYLQEHAFNIDSVNEYGEASYTLDNFKGTINFYYKNNDYYSFRYEKLFPEPKIINVSGSQDEIVESILREDLFWNGSIINSDYIAYILNMATINLDSVVNEIVDLEFVLNDRVTIVIERVMPIDFSQYSSFNFELPNDYLIFDEVEPTIDLVKEQLIISVDFISRYILNAREKEEVFTRYSVELDSAKQVIIIYDEKGNFYKEIYYNPITSIEANHVESLELNLGEMISYDLAGNPFDNLTYVIFVDGFDSNNLADYVGYVNINTKVESVYYKGGSQELVSFVNNYVVITPINDVLYQLDINYGDYSQTIYLVVHNYDDRYYTGADYWYDDVSNVLENDDEESLLNYLTNGFHYIRIYGNYLEDIYYDTPEDIKSFLEQCQIKLVTEDVTKRAYDIIYQYVTINVKVTIKPNVLNYLDRVNFYLEDNAIATDGEVTEELVIERLTGHIDEYVLTKEDILNIIDNYVITIDAQNNRLVITYGNIVVADLFYGVISLEEAYQITGIQVYTKKNYFSLNYDLSGNEVENTYLFVIDDVVDKEYVLNEIIREICIYMASTSKSYYADTEEYTAFINQFVNVNFINNQHAEIVINYSNKYFSYEEIYTFIFESSDEQSITRIYISVPDGIVPFDSQTTTLIEYLAHNISIEVSCSDGKNQILDSNEALALLERAEIVEIGSSVTSKTYSILVDYAKIEFSLQIKPDLLSHLSEITFFLPNNHLICDDLVTVDLIKSQLQASLDSYELTTSEIDAIIDNYDIVLDEENGIFDIIYNGQKVASCYYLVVSSETANELISVDIFYSKSSSVENVDYDLAGNQINGILIYSDDLVLSYEYLVNEFITGVYMCTIIEDNYYYRTDDEAKYQEFMAKYATFNDLGSNTYELVFQDVNKSYTFMVISSKEEYTVAIYLYMNEPSPYDEASYAIEEYLADNLTQVEIKLTNGTHLVYDKQLDILNFLLTCQMEINEFIDHFAIIIIKDFTKNTIIVPKVIDLTKDYSELVFESLVSEIAISDLGELTVEKMLNEYYFISYFGTSGYTKVSTEQIVTLLPIYSLVTEESDTNIYNCYLVTSDGIKTPSIVCYIV